jgi:hypothetical protein
MKSSPQISHPHRFVMGSPTGSFLHGLTIEIGEIPILVRTDSFDFANLLENRYGEFVTESKRYDVMELKVEFVRDLRDRNSGFGKDTDREVSVRVESGRWVIERGDFRAEWDLRSNRGCLTQRANPYAIDAVLRILHSLFLARIGGFLVHAASVVRNGRAFVFAGVSGTGKTTLARLAPRDVALLTDEISYVSPGSRTQGPRPEGRSSQPKPSTARCESGTDDSDPPFPKSLTRPLQAFGTPFAGELACIGRNVRAPLGSLFLLQPGLENRIEALSKAEAARQLLRHVLFFARDEELVRMLFQTVLDFVTRVPVRRLVFAGDARVWELIT